MQKLLSFADFRNESGLPFTDITSEALRTYYQGDRKVLVLENPVALYVSENGHRIVGQSGRCFYLKNSGFDMISWEPKDGHPHFVK